MHALALLTCVALFTVAVTSGAAATTFYVRPDGHDTASGMNNSPDAKNGAWRTLQHAADVVAAGETVHVADGTYAGFMIETAGTGEKPITFHALGGSVNITTRNATTPDGINIESYSSTPPDYITIDGFHVYNQPRMGIRAIGGRGIIIRNCTVHHNAGTGIFTANTPSVHIQESTVFNNGTSGTDHNIYVSNSNSDNCVIRRNTVYGARGGNGIQLNGDWQSGGEGYISGPLIENNVVYNNHHKGLSLISVKDGTFRNNIIHHNGISAGGIHLVDQLGRNFSTGNAVANNTIDEPSIACVRINAGSTDNAVFNNICIGATGIVFEGSGNYQSNNISATSGGAIFMSYARHDYRLTAQSPAIGYGTAIYREVTAPGLDIDGKMRPQGGSFDAGAYEFTTTCPACRY